jgi:hypothetical protein
MECSHPPYPVIPAKEHSDREPGSGNQKKLDSGLKIAGMTRGEIWIPDQIRHNGWNAQVPPKRSHGPAMKNEDNTHPI